MVLEHNHRSIYHVYLYEGVAFSGLPQYVVVKNKRSYTESDSHLLYLVLGHIW